MGDFNPVPCSHCGNTIESKGRLHELGDNNVHKNCAAAFVNKTPKMELTPETCSDCYRSFWTERGLEHHRDRNHV